jgi:hypothetical protein
VAHRRGSVTRCQQRGLEPSLSLLTLPTHKKQDMRQHDLCWNLQYSCRLLAQETTSFRPKRSDFGRRNVVKFL